MSKASSMSSLQAVVDEFFETDDWPEIFEDVYEDCPIPLHELISLHLIARHLTDSIPMDLPEDAFTERIEDNQKRFDEDWIVKDITSKYPSIEFRLTYFDGFHLKHYDRLVW